MAGFPIHDETTAPEGARAALEGAKAWLGFAPSLFGALAENPAALEACQTLSRIFDKAGFDPLERQVATLAASVEHACHFCVAAQSAVSAGQKLDPDVIAALREDRPIADAKLEALRQLTKKTVVQRGFVSDADVAGFLGAG